jgi:tripartite-type tricarboxylate transporter receptor subunit TctC
MAGELLKLAAHINIVHIPYKGAGLHSPICSRAFPIDVSDFTVGSPVYQKRQAPPARADERQALSAFPDVPTMAEAGVPGVVAMAGSAFTRLRARRKPSSAGCTTKQSKCCRTRS